MILNAQTNTSFKKGISGNPSGRPPGSRNKSTIAIEQMLEGEAAAFLEAVREGAPSPIPFQELIEVARFTIEAADACR